MNYKDISKNELEKKILEGLSQKELSLYFGVSESTIRNKLKFYNLKSKRPRCAHRTDQEKENEIIKLYTEGDSSCKIAKKMRMHQPTVLNIIKRNGGVIRSNKDSSYNKYQLDQSYFEVIDTEDKAYFLGLFSADGCMRKQNYSINIGLKKEDSYLLEYFNCKIYKTEHKLNILNKNFLSLGINNKKMYNDLISIGLTDRKSLTLKFPSSNKIPEKLIHHFIRGYFDGDGCITCGVYKTRHYIQFKGNVNIVGSEDFIRSLGDILLRIISTSINISPFKHSSRCFRLLFSARESIKIFYDYIYRDSTIFMKRKKIKFDQFFIKSILT